MHITRYADIGLRILIYLAGPGNAPERTPVTAGEIARQFDIPQNHLVKVAAQLARAGWIEATRGRNGGLALRADPRTLRIGTVLRELEGEVELIDCAALDCRLQANCLLRSALANGLRAFYTTMDAYTLADIAGGAVGAQIIGMHREFTRISPVAVGTTG